MLKRFAIGLTATLATLAVSSPGRAFNGEPCYSYWFYTDETHTVPAGSGHGFCTSLGPSFTVVSGVGTMFYETEQIGVCIDGVLWPS
ncbi:MAG TPA: hypothetical protein VMG08_08585 [Allosphingosinicella sp.]|nr:hypothetical protein [Allosphingosinicella sp.]